MPMTKEDGKTLVRERCELLTLALIKAVPKGVRLPMAQINRYTADWLEENETDFLADEIWLENKSTNWLRSLPWYKRHSLELQQTCASNGYALTVNTKGAMLTKGLKYIREDMEAKQKVIETHEENFNILAETYNKNEKGNFKRLAFSYFSTALLPPGDE